MSRLLYLANNRLPTEKAHGLQIVQMCEAFADAGYTVTLVTARRLNTPELRRGRDLWAHYGVKRNFAFRRLPTLDLINLLPVRMQRITFPLQVVTYLLALAIWLLPRRADVIYTRDLYIAVLVKLIRPQATLAYEVHQLHQSRVGRWLQGIVVRRTFVCPVTAHLADQLKQQGAGRILVQHDGFRAARFESLPAKAEARAALGIPPEAFVVGYVGQLHTMRMSKGLDTLVEAIAESGIEAYLLLVGGPEDGVIEVRRRWSARGLPGERLHAVGQVRPDAVPRYLAAMDVGALPLPWTAHFAYYASPIKLFEYMAAGCVVLASDLPSTAEVVRDGESALLVPPGDVTAWADALRRLADDPDLRDRLRQQAQANARGYTWGARAGAIREWLDNK